MHVETLFFISRDILLCLYVIVESFFTMLFMLPLRKHRVIFHLCLFDRRDTLLIFSTFYKTTCKDTLLYLWPLGALENIKNIIILEWWSFEASKSRPHTIQLHNPQLTSHLNVTSIVSYTLSIILMSIPWCASMV